ncbi:hypothetical protein FOA52_006357 [Chlamydomonas sp. UWO 241]|nr:hypothetical protein FOA52_006357 [Chlamydomonas sp. UWO 241]
MSILNSMMNDMFDKVATEASHLSRYTKKPTITSREIQTAVRLVLPARLLCCLLATTPNTCRVHRITTCCKHTSSVDERHKTTRVC